MAKMYLMTGVSGSGKTTFAQRFAAIENLKVFDVDKFYSTLSHEGEDKFKVWIKFYEAIHEAELADEDIIVDTNCLTMTDRAEFLSWFPKFEHYLISITAERTLCVSNNLFRDRVVPGKTLLNMFNMWERPTSTTDGALHYRSSWKSCLRIHNNNNHFEYEGFSFGLEEWKSKNTIYNILQEVNKKG